MSTIEVLKDYLNYCRIIGQAKTTNLDPEVHMLLHKVHLYPRVWVPSGVDEPVVKNDIPRTNE